MRNDEEPFVITEARTWLRQEMERQAISVSDLSADTDCSPTTIVRINRGDNFRVCTLAKLARALGFDMHLTFLPMSLEDLRDVEGEND